MDDAVLTNGFFMNELFYEDLQKAGYTDGEIKLIDEFLKKMSRVADEYVVKIFTRCRKKAPFIEILATCRSAFDNVWKYGTPDRIGDPDDVAPIGVPDSRRPVYSRGMTNIKAYCIIYEILGMGCPKTL